MSYWKTAKQAGVQGGFAAKDMTIIYQHDNAGLLKEQKQKEKKSNCHQVHITSFKGDL